MFTSRIDIPIYFGYLNIVFADDLQAASDKFKLSLDNKSYAAFVESKKDKKGLAEYWMVFDMKELDHTIVAHETVHCANWIFHDINAKPDLINDEPYAYLVGWITKQVYKLATKHKVIIL